MIMIYFFVFLFFDNILCQEQSNNAYLVKDQNSNSQTTPPINTPSTTESHEQSDMFAEAMIFAGLLGCCALAGIITGIVSLYQWIQKKYCSNSEQEENPNAPDTINTETIQIEGPQIIP
jgi:hypothetical protein